MLGTDTSSRRAGRFAGGLLMLLLAGCGSAAAPSPAASASPPGAAKASASAAPAASASADALLAAAKQEGMVEIVGAPGDTFRQAYDAFTQKYGIQYDLLTGN